MSLQIIKAGLHDTVQDLGRYGYQHLGINTSGAMDRFSASLANALLGKELNAPVTEMHFPAPVILFQSSTIICLSGADFTPTINNKAVPLHQPIIVHSNCILEFKKHRRGARCYLTTLQNFSIEKWLGSYSTNLKAMVGGYNGRRLLKGDVIEFENCSVSLAKSKLVENLPWQYHETVIASNDIEFIPGPEWEWLTKDAQTSFLNNGFVITPASDRMGYRLQSEALQQHKTESLVSSPVNFGTVQLLPNGGLIILMADAQTTGGYPRIAAVISVHLSKLAQMNPGATIRFAMTNVEEAEKKFVAQQAYLLTLQNTCRVKMQNRFHAH